MPLYQWHCFQCDKSFESLSKPFEKVACPHCGTCEINKEVSAIATYKIWGNNSASTTPKKDQPKRES